MWKREKDPYSLAAVVHRNYTVVSVYRRNSLADPNCLTLSFHPSLFAEVLFIYIIAFTCSFVSVNFQYRIVYMEIYKDNSYILVQKYLLNLY